MPAYAGISESRTSERYSQCGDSGIRRNDKREVLPTLTTRLTLSTLKTIIEDLGSVLSFHTASVYSFNESRISNLESRFFIQDLGSRIRLSHPESSIISTSAYKKGRRMFACLQDRYCWQYQPNACGDETS